MFPINISKFSCTGPDCIDNCCYGWTINIEAEYFEKQKEKNPELYEEMMKCTGSNEKLSIFNEKWELQETEKILNSIKNKYASK